MKTFKHQELRTKLLEHLYTDTLFNPHLTCSNNQGKTIDCPNGFCQLTGNITTTIDRQCVSQGKGTNPAGIQIGLNNIEGLDNVTTIIYACNKVMCNGADTDKNVRELLNDYGIFGTKNPPPSPLRSCAMTIMNFQWVLLLIIKSLF